MTFIAGRYSVTYGAASMGQVQDGITVSHRHFKTLVTGDNFAQTPQDACFQGAEMFVQYELLEYDAAGVRAAIWPYDTTALYSMVTTVGNFDVQNSLAKELVLTAVANTPASTAPASITFGKVIIAEGFDVSLLFAPSLRTVPLRHRVYPNNQGLFGTVA